MDFHSALFDHRVALLFASLSSTHFSVTLSKENAHNPQSVFPAQENVFDW